MSRVLTVVAALVAAALAFPPDLAAEVSPSDVTGDPDVVEQRERLGRARSLLDAASEDLTAAIEAYEHTRAHAHRLENDLDATERVQRDAALRAEQAESAFKSQVRASYAARPELMMTEALLASPDPATALRSADLLRGTTLRSSAVLHRAERSSGTATADAGLHRDLVSAVAAAAADQRVAADDLEAAVSRATSAVSAAESDLDAAVQDAMERERRRLAEERRRQEEERRRRAAEERRQATAVVAGSQDAPVPDPSGRVCPVGEPHGFIDSWGFPRSGGRRHQGVDMFAARGTPVYAVAAGTISRVGNNRLGGLVVDLVDGDGHRYYYAHLDAQLVRRGQRVAAGDVIGTVGNTGNARGGPDHLHFEMHHGSVVNPFATLQQYC